MILFYPLLLVLYVIVFVFWTFAAAFLYLFVPFVIYALTFAVMVVIEVVKWFVSGRRPQWHKPTRKPTKPLPQARWSNRR